ncbi:MAG: molybdopterin molybdotransferase MoeA [Candidatus Bathyarchaeia archaeon]
MQRKDQKRTFKLISYDDALKKLFEITKHIKPISYEKILVESSVGRVLAEDIRSEVNIPPNDQALIDGYAIKSEDALNASLDNPVRLKVVGKLYPWNTPTDFNLVRGQTIYVTCGAPLPKGADAVIKVENTILHDDEIEIRHAVKKGENVALKGEDLKEGSLIFRKGNVLRLQDIGFLAGVGVRKVKVFKKPKVAIIATGNELYELSKKEPTRIVDNYALIISFLISKLGGIPIRLGIAPDDLSELKNKINEGAEKADIIVTIGGCSVGEKDFVPDAVNSMGEPGVIVHGVKVKPGRVTGFGLVKGKPIIMLPGLIASTLAGFFLFAAPLICFYNGLERECLLPKVKAKMTQNLEADERLHYRFLPVRLKQDGKNLMAELVVGGPGSLRRFLDSNGFILISPGKSLRKGEDIEVTLFGCEEFTKFLS